MIPFDFDYYRPESIKEAIDIFYELDKQGKNPLYYSGGSEIISMARVNNVQTEAVIDIKYIPECKVLKLEGNNLIIGSAVTLSNITESKLFPLLGQTVARIADHTMQCKITIGGNINSTIIYREGVLPLLLSDSLVEIATKNGIITMPLKEIFDRRVQIKRGEFIIRFILDKKYSSFPFFHVKITKNEKIDYPVVTIVAMKTENEIKVGLSGVCTFPFRSELIEKELNDANKTWQERINNVIKKLPEPIISDIYASNKYREFVLRNNLLKMLEMLEGDINVESTR